MFNKRIVFIAACLGLLLFGIAALTLGSIAPDLKSKYALDDLAAGTLFAIFPIGIMGGSLLFGPVSDRYGYRVMLTSSALLLGVGFAGLAYGKGLGALQISIVLIGLGGGAINGATSGVVSDISGDSDRGANLSLLGVFFGVGALGMPFLLGILKHILPYEPIVSAVAVLSFLAAGLFLLIGFPKPKQGQGLPLSSLGGLLRDGALWLIAFFLFFQSAFEAIINNWTTSFLEERLSVAGSQALYALSSYVAGITGMRLLTGSIFRRVPVRQILYISMGLIFLGALTLHLASSLALAIAGLVLLGAGLAGGFPIMLGFVGGRFPEISGTALSFVLVVALVGNMLINYFMGVAAQSFGVGILTYAALIQWAFMAVLVGAILRRL